MVEQQGITKISVQGFKSLYDKAEIDIRPLTILAGANSSGKSSIMQPLLLMKQTLELNYDPGTFKLDGPNVWFTEAREFLAKRPIADGFVLTPYNNFSISITLGTSRLTNLYKLNDVSEIHVTSTHYESPTDSFSLRLGMKPENLMQQIGEDVDKIRTALEPISVGGKVLWSIEHYRCFLNLGMRFENGEQAMTGGGLFLKIFPLNDFIHQIRSIIHVPGLRGNPQRAYPVSAVSDIYYEGTFEKYLASVIRHWFADANYLGVVRNLEQYLLDLGLSTTIRLSPIDKSQFGILVSQMISYQHSKENTPAVSIADVGFGVSQVLPVLVALLVAKAGQLVYIEQPELHLHPRAQVKLAQILADAANRGVRVVVETHSSLLLLGLQTLIAEGKLDPEKTVLHWFTRDEAGKTTVTSQTPDENGAYGDWPEDFSEVELNAQTRFISAAERKLWEQPSGD